MVEENRSRSRALVLLCAMLFLAYAVQVHSPLRVNTDAVTILQLTAKLTDGKPFLTDGHKPLFPIGVPFLFSRMEKAGLATPQGFAIFNLTGLTIAAVAAWLICRYFDYSKPTANAIVAAAFSSFVIFKHSVIPLTDIPFMATSLACVAALESRESDHGLGRLLALIISLALVAASILTRRIGVALIPAFLFTLRPTPPQFSRLKSTLFTATGRIVAGVAILIVSGIGVLVVRKLLYLPDFQNSYRQSTITSVFAGTLRLRLTDLGEVCANTPVSQLARLHSAIYFASVIPILLIATAMYRDRDKLRPTHVYLLAYFAIMLIWPFGDARFWLPVLPLIAMFVWRGFQPFAHWRIARTGGVCYLAAYGLAGMAALAYTTRLTFAGKRFAELYGASSVRQAYNSAASTRPDLDDPTVAMIRRYEFGHKE